MSLTLRILLIVGSILVSIECLRKCLKSQLRVNETIRWVSGCAVLILMSIFSDAVSWISNKLGFISASNFVFFALIFFLLIQAFTYSIKISELNEKIKETNHYIALKEKKKKKDDGRDND